MQIVTDDCRLMPTACAPHAGSAIPQKCCGEKVYEFITESVIFGKAFALRFDMVTSHETTAEIGFTFCDSCFGRQLESDKYCRQCGISRHRPGYNTRPLSGPTHDLTSFTNPIIKVVTAELDQLPVSVRNNPWAMRLVSTLIAIPIWIIIVLLSPINTYMAIRAIARQG